MHASTGGDDNRSRPEEPPTLLRRGRWAAILLALAVAVTAVAAFAAGRTGLVTFQPITAGEFTQRLSGLLLVALFIERALEVFISGWRGPGESRLRRAVARARPDASGGGGGQAAGAESEPLERSRDALVHYKAETRRIAFVASVLLGVAVAAMGVRVLGQFIDPSVFAELGGAQRQGFQLLDILLTGAALAGGSDGLHQLIETFTGFLESSKERVKGS